MDGRNYFRPTAVRAKTLVRGDVLKGTGLIIRDVYEGKDHEILDLMRGSALIVPTLGPDGQLQEEGLTDPSKILVKMVSGYVLVKASRTGKEDLDETVFFLTPTLSMVEVWQFESNG